MSNKIYTILVSPTNTEKTKFTKIVNTETGLTTSIQYESEAPIEVFDGYHTMDELYEHRMRLFVAFLNWTGNTFRPFKSRVHYDGTMFGPEWFIAGLMEGDGIKDKCYISYHLKVDPYWDLLDVPELDRAPEWDGHTSKNVLERLRDL